MNKTEITTALNSFISAIGKVTKVRHTSANALIVDEIYNQPVVDNHTTQTFTTKSGSVLAYGITIIKVGNIAHISGNVTNTSGATVNSQNIFSFKESQFKPRINLENINIIATAQNTQSVIKLLLTDVGISYSGTGLASGPSYQFELTTYITQN
jgi:hypothetical protein